MNLHASDYLYTFIRLYKKILKSAMHKNMETTFNVSNNISHDALYRQTLHRMTE